MPSSGPTSLLSRIFGIFIEFGHPTSPLPRIFGILVKLGHPTFGLSAHGAAHLERSILPIRPFWFKPRWIPPEALELCFHRIAALFHVFGGFVYLGI
jgi:hypothetical protein